MFNDWKDKIIQDQQDTIKRLNDQLDTEQKLRWTLMDFINNQQKKVKV